MSPDKEKKGPSYLTLAKLLAQALVGVPLTKDQKDEQSKKRRDEKLKTWYAAGTEIGRHVMGRAIEADVTSNGVSSLFLGALNGVEEHLSVPENRKEIIDVLAPRAVDTVKNGLKQARDQIAANVSPIVESISLSVDPGQTAAQDTSFVEIRHKLVGEDDSFFTKLLKGGAALAIKGVSEGAAYIGAFVHAKSKGYTDTKDEVAFRNTQYGLYRNMLFGTIRSMMGLNPNPRNLSTQELADREKRHTPIRTSAKESLWRNVVPAPWVANPPVPTAINP